MAIRLVVACGVKSCYDRLSDSGDPGASARSSRRLGLLRGSEMVVQSSDHWKRHCERQTPLLDRGELSWPSFAAMNRLRIPSAMITDSIIEYFSALIVKRAQQHPELPKCYYIGQQPPLDTRPTLIDSTPVCFTPSRRSTRSGPLTLIDLDSESCLAGASYRGQPFQDRCYIPQRGRFGRV